MKNLPLTQGQVALVDDADFERANDHKWSASKARCGDYYARRGVRLSDGRYVHQYLHQFILGVKGGDHRNGSRLDCRRENLRVATVKQNNQASRRKRDGATSQYRGVCWNSRYNKWEAQINTGGKHSFLGYFLQEKEAARAYDRAAKKLFGEFAAPNFV